MFAVFTAPSWRRRRSLVEQGGELDVFIEARVEVRRDNRGARELRQHLAFKLAAMIIISVYC